MKLKDGWITQEMGDAQIMLAADGSGFSGLVRSNKTAAFIVDCLKTETTEEEIVAAVSAKYEAPREVVARDVAAILEQLKSIGALE